MDATSKLDGAKFLEKALDVLGEEFYRSAGRAVIRGALAQATKPTIAQMRAVVPRGSKSHLSYKGRRLPPGFLSRSITARTRISRRNGNLVRTIGVREEAFYGVQFVPYGITRGGKNTTPKDWLAGTFIDQQPRMAKTFNDELIPQIEKTAERISRRQKIKR